MKCDPLFCCSQKADVVLNDGSRTPVQIVTSDQLRTFPKFWEDLKIGKKKRLIYSIVVAKCDCIQLPADFSARQKWIGFQGGESPPRFSCPYFRESSLSWPNDSLCQGLSIKNLRRCFTQPRLHFEFNNVTLLNL